MFRRKWTKKQQALFLLNTGRCLEQGYPLHMAIQLQGYQQKSVVQNRIEKVLDLLKKGHPVHHVLMTCGFPNDVCSFVFYAEQSGRLAEGLCESGDMLMKREAHKETLQKLLRYPMFLMWMLAIMIYLVCQFLFPSFLRLYDAMAIDLPFITKAMISISNHFLTISFVSLGLLVGCLLVIFFIQRFSSIERKITILLMLPLISSYTKLYLTHYFSFHFGSLIKSGLSVNDALITLSQQKKASFFQNEAQKMQTEFRRGDRLEQIINSRSFYVKELVHVITNGQLNGMLGLSLFNYSDTILKKMEDQATTLMAVVQPAMLMIIGGLVLGLFSSILLPVFHIMNGL